MCLKLNMADGDRERERLVGVASAGEGGLQEIGPHSPSRQEGLLDAHMRLHNGDPKQKLPVWSVGQNLS